jgi:signal transduction histidine kinase
MPGTLTSCFLVTVMTVMLAVFAGHEKVDAVLRPLYFALLYGAFAAVRLREKRLAGVAFRLVEMGFLVLTLGFATASVLRLLGMAASPYVVQMERGAIFLLGLSTVCYGIILFVPDLLENYGGLRKRHARTRGRLQEVTLSHDRMERRIVEAEGHRSLGELAAGVAHDLRNPLTIVKATAESLARKERTHDQVAEHVRIINRNIEKAERTIAALLNLGKPRELAMRETSLHELVTEVTTLIAVQYRHKGVRLSSPTGTDVRVETDPKLLLRALLNLLINALHASEKGSEVRIKVREFRFADSSMAAIAVEDVGTGLPDDVRERLFTPFFTTKEEGTGLGLLSCRRILDDLGGRIGLFPRHWRGARAVVLLPLQPMEVLVS